MQTGAYELEGSSTEKAFGTLMDNRQTKSQQYTLAEMYVRSTLDCMRVSVVIRSREVIPLPSTGKAMNSYVQHWVSQYKKYMDLWSEPGATCMKVSKELHHLTAKTARSGQPGEEKVQGGLIHV